MPALRRPLSWATLPGCLQEMGLSGIAKFDGWVRHVPEIPELEDLPLAELNEQGKPVNAGSRTAALASSMLSPLDGGATPRSSAVTAAMANLQPLILEMKPSELVEPGLAGASGAQQAAESGPAQWDRLAQADAALQESVAGVDSLQQEEEGSAAQAQAAPAEQPAEAAGGQGSAAGAPAEAVRGSKQAAAAGGSLADAAEAAEAAEEQEQGHVREELEMRIEFSAPNSRTAAVARPQPEGAAAAVARTADITSGVKNVIGDDQDVQRILTRASIAAPDGELLSCAG